MRCDGGRGTELLVSIGVSVTRCQTESEGGPSSREFFSPPLGGLGTPLCPKVVDDVESERSLSTTGISDTANGSLTHI